jgi:hypothetical protein
MFFTEAPVRIAALRAVALVALVAAAGCGPSHSVDSAEQARRAYLGIDLSIDRAINLGFQGFNDSSNANIPTETASGGTGGTVTVTGQVDHGASANRSMHLNAAYAMYADPVTDGDSAVLHIVYDSASAAPTLGMMLMSVPNGTVTGTFDGALTMSGDLAGTLTLALTFTGQLRPVAGSTTQIERVPGTTHVTGTATSQYGTYEVDITR